jgi:ABC-type phosphate transport system substrate-binding protein
LSGGTNYGQNWMTAYNYPSAQALGASGADAAIGSGAGQTAIGCFAESFAGTDIPVTATQIGNINNGTYTSGSGGTESNGKYCNPVSSTAGALVTPFTPQPTFPNPGDSVGLSPSGIMVVPIGISAVSVFANLPTSCGTTTLTNADMENIWGGTYTNWDQVPGLSSCNLAITRVVRNDNSGTTQSVDNYLAAISSYGSSGVCAGNTLATASSWKNVQNNQALNGTNANIWPQGSGCSTLTNSGSPGGPSLITDVETTNGAIGYADLSDAQQDTNGFKSKVSGDTIDEFSVQASNSATNFQSPRSGTGSNCTTTESAPGTGNAAVGVGGSWNLLAQTSANQGASDISYAREGSTYPICSLTWDMVWTGDDGNGANSETPAPANLSAVAAGAKSIPLDSSTIAGVPDSFTSSAANGSITVAGDTISYTGLDASTDTLTGVSGVTNAISPETSFTYPSGTGGPEANLTADQRRTLYSYFTYLTSPAAQNSETSAGYAPLPTPFLNLIRQGFQANF